MSALNLLNLVKIVQAISIDGEAIFPKIQWISSFFGTCLARVANMLAILTTHFLQLFIDIFIERFLSRNWRSLPKGMHTPCSTI
jgi:hypothetical protein